MDPSSLHTTESEPAVPAVEVPPAVEVEPSVADTVETGEHTYKFDVKMTCGGCAGAVTRALDKAKPEGISWFDVSSEKQEVIVKGTIPFETLLEKIKKTGKEVRSGVTVE